MIKQYESRFLGANGRDLFFQSWINPNATKTIVVTHGLAEHSECYADFAEQMGKDGYNVYAWDMYGHGRSEGKRGYVADFNHFVEDLSVFIQVVAKDIPEDHAIILFGHSMGGLVTLLQQVQMAHQRVKAIALSSPAVGYAIKVSALKNQLAKLSHRFFPTLTLYNEISYSDLTHDSTQLASYETDSLRHDKVCSNIYLGMMDGFNEVFERSHEISIPIIFQLAGQDRLVSTSRSRALFEQIDVEPKALEIYADSFHEIFNDLERHHCLSDLKSFLRNIK